MIRFALIVASTLGFVLTAALGNLMTPLLRAFRVRQEENEPPTMGGLCLMVGTLAAVGVGWTAACVAQPELLGTESLLTTRLLIALFGALCFGAVGLADDLVRLRHRSPLGLRRPVRLALEAASGTLVLDPMFEEHFTNVKNAGLKVGVYFFSQATTEEEAKEEAFACAYVLNGRKLDYPIFFDTEASGASNGSGRADGLGMEDRTKCAIAFCEEVKAQGYKPGVYASTLWYRKRVDLNSLKKYTIWNAHYGVASSPIDCALWQGTCTARLPGYKGDMDVNISYIG